jgi:hypothetical protein
MYLLTGTLRLSPTLELGGEGVVGLRSVRLAGGESELTFGYGGALLRWRPAGDLPGLRVGGGLLAGAGTARVRSLAGGGPSTSENHYVLEPRVNASLRVHDRVRTFAALGYRIVFGTGTLPGVGITDLRGPILSVGAQLIVGP